MADIEGAEQLGFTPRQQTRWLAPGQLARTGLEVLVATLASGVQDKREVQAVLPAAAAPVLGADGADFWFDFAADTGDGFDATYTVAWMLARPWTVEGQELELKPGSLLVLGGDEVYPTPSTTRYEDQLKGVFEAALPARGNDPRTLLALPGNHDWYDGLTSFLRVFAAGASVGAWRTPQSRSYFAARLPKGWWLVGVDTQFDTYVDSPQVEYFRTVLVPHLREGDSVVLCVPKPSWYDAGEHPGGFDHLHWFERNVVERTPDGKDTGARVRLWLTGDKHHYARYAEVGGTGRQLVTCGLGGAYLGDTHRLPDQVVIPPAGSRVRGRHPAATFERAACYPAAADSRRMARRLAYPWSGFWLPRRNPGFFRLLGYAHVALLLAYAFVLGQATGTPPLRAVALTAVPTALVVAAWVLGAVLAGLLFLHLVSMAKARRLLPPHPAPTELFLQLVAASVVMVAMVALPLPGDLPRWGEVGLVLGTGAVVAFVLGGVLGCVTFAVHVCTRKEGEVAGWQMSGQAVEDHKGFVRMRITPEGVLELYPLAVAAVCRVWAVDPAAPGPSLVNPKGPRPQPQLVDEVVRVQPTGPR